jgi:hypothetical protein
MFQLYKGKQFAGNWKLCRVRSAISDNNRPADKNLVELPQQMGVRAVTP